MRTAIDDDVEVNLDPYLVVRFTYTCVPDEIKDLQWGVLLNDGKLSNREVGELVGDWLRRNDKSEEILEEAAGIFQSWVVDDKLAARKEGR